MSDAVKNFAYSTIATAPSPATSGLTLVVQSGKGADFPSSFPYSVVIWPAGAQPTNSNAEIATVSGISADTFTIIRAREGTSARTIVVGDQISAAITAKSLTDRDGPRFPTENFKVRAGYGVVIPGRFEIPSGKILEIESTGCLEIT